MAKKYIATISLGMVLYAAWGVWAAEKKPISITVLYDNYALAKDVKAEWGFSCIIQGTQRSILFDTGRAKDIFYDNIKTLKPRLEQVSQMVISHNHSDHTGNLFNILSDNHRATVYLPASFPIGFIDKVKAAGADVVAVHAPMEICRHVFLTGEMLSNAIAEQSLVIDTAKGLVVIVGCSHPGIVNIIRKAQKIVNKDVYLVMGGFHMLDDKAHDIETTIREFKQIGVLKVGPTHCTGDNAIESFKKAYGENFIQMGVGKVLNIPG